MGSLVLDVGCSGIDDVIVRWTRYETCKCELSSNRRQQVPTIEGPPLSRLRGSATAGSGGSLEDVNLWTAPARKRSVGGGWAGVAYGKYISISTCSERRNRLTSRLGRCKTKVAGPVGTTSLMQY